jgi:hypothetical protein
MAFKLWHFRQQMPFYGSNGEQHPSHAETAGNRSLSNAILSIIIGKTRATDKAVSYDAVS